MMDTATTLRGANAPRVLVHGMETQRRDRARVIYVAMDSWPDADIPKANVILRGADPFEVGRPTFVVFVCPHRTQWPAGTVHGAETNTSNPVRLMNFGIHSEDPLQANVILRGTEPFLSGYLASAGADANTYGTEWSFETLPGVESSPNEHTSLINLPMNPRHPTSHGDLAQANIVVGSDRSEASQPEYMRFASPYGVAQWLAESSDDRPQRGAWVSEDSSVFLSLKHPMGMQMGVGQQQAGENSEALLGFQIGNRNSSLIDALMDLARIVEDAEESDYPVPTELARSNAERMLKAMYRISPRRFEIYPMPDGKIGIDGSGRHGRWLILFCESDGGASCLVGIDGNREREHYDAVDDLPDLARSVLGKLD